ncbi:MAG: DUF3182 family protein [Aliihoeflea sp.]|uniref:DUF3182 family protein n=1 Tax=Aliihoeflea sp. TaxID=2608088 RepID=UPI0040383C59
MTTVSPSVGRQRLQHANETVGAPQRTVFTLECMNLARHEHAGHDVLSRRLAALLGYAYGGELDSEVALAGSYLVPRRPLVGAEADSLGVADENAFFGGSTAESFMATKAITHPLISGAAIAPPQWSHALSVAVTPLTLAGFTAFARQDALEAGRMLFEHCGEVRLKQVYRDGGRDQEVFRNLPDLQAKLGKIDDKTIALGLVLEENLKDVDTLSVGQVRVPGCEISYFGTQSLTRDNVGQEAYGGSDLFIVRGGFDRLVTEAMTETVRDAIAKAVEFDSLAETHLNGFIASRRNYDIACGVGWNNVIRIGLLEQSWRIGGASGAEILALEAFSADPLLQNVRARTVERYGLGAIAPSDAMIIFQGNDPFIGNLLKYAVLEDRFAG